MFGYSTSCCGIAIEAIVAALRPRTDRVLTEGLLCSARTMRCLLPSDP